MNSSLNHLGHTLSENEAQKPQLSQRKPRSEWDSPEYQNKSTDERNKLKKDIESKNKRWLFIRESLGLFPSPLTIPKLSPVESKVDKNNEVITITNGVDSLELVLVENEDGVIIPALSGNTHKDWIYFSTHTFASDDIKEIVQISTLALNLLEIRRYPEKYGYSEITGYTMWEKGNIQVLFWKNKAIDVPMKYSLGINYSDIIEYIDTIFENIKPQLPPDSDSWEMHA